LVFKPCHKALETDDALHRHSLIVIYKTAFYSFYLPVALAMMFCGIESPSLLSSPLAPKSNGVNGHTNGHTNGHAAAAPEDPYKLALDILIPLGEYFQVQDDFLDFSGTPEQIGKVGTDIIDNKCSWCVNAALAACTPAQRAVLDANYGRKDGACEARVKALFEEVGVREKYAAYEEDAVGRIRKMIATIPEKAKGEEGLKREVFTVFLEKIYKRTK
jgi:farnesyl diphosphate synthase